MLFAATNGHSGSSSRPKYELLDNFLPNTEKVSFTQFIDDEGPNNGQQLKVDNVTNNTLKTSNIIPVVWFKLLIRVCVYYKCTI